MILIRVLRVATKKGKPTPIYLKKRFLGTLGDVLDIRKKYPAPMFQVESRPLKDIQYLLPKIDSLII